MSDSKFWTWQRYLLRDFRPAKCRNGLIVWALRFASYATDGEAIYASAERMSADLGYSVSTIKWWRAECVKAGVLRPTGRRRNGQRELTLAMANVRDQTLAIANDALTRPGLPGLTGEFAMSNENHKETNANAGGSEEPPHSVQRLPEQTLAIANVSEDPWSGSAEPDANAGGSEEPPRSCTESSSLVAPPPNPSSSESSDARRSHEALREFAMSNDSDSADHDPADQYGSNRSRHEDDKDLHWRERHFG